MTLKDFPHPDDTPTMMQPDEYHRYLKAFVKHFKLEENIQIKTLVTHVKLIKNCKPEMLEGLSEEQLTRKFLVTTKHIETREVKRDTYDHIVCCNGRNSKKFIPDFTGKDDWDGIQLHMHEFRDIDKDMYKDKIVLIVGSGISACDYIYHLLMSSWKAEPSKCYLAGRSMDFITKTTDYRGLLDEGKLEFCKTNVKEFKKGRVDKFISIIGRKVVLRDGTELNVDIVMYATGYEFNLPFLDKEDNIVEIERERSGGRFLYPMFKKMVAIREPNFNIIGLLTGSPIPLAGVDRQIMFSLCILNGWVKLPSKKAMLDECHNEIELTTVTLNRALDKVFRYDKHNLSIIRFYCHVLGERFFTNFPKLLPFY